ncbi:hypothetical protein DFJ73DRAFT_757167 [Zopfochytrium polystomum]|nr:hypothetical protein DFJ73DRAFT_757167 [Zopfochytrium polystomum]
MKYYVQTVLKMKVKVVKRVKKSSESDSETDDLAKKMKKLKLRSGLSKNKKWITTIETAFTEDGNPRLIKKVKRYFKKDKKRKAPEMDMDVSDVIETEEGENTEENTEEMEDLMEAIRKNMEREAIVGSSSKGKERERDVSENENVNENVNEIDNRKGKERETSAMEEDDQTSVMIEQKDVIKFRGEKSWLSNLYPCRVEVDGEVYGSVEEYYQCEKFSRIDPSYVKKN